MRAGDDAQVWCHQGVGKAQRNVGAKRPQHIKEISSGPNGTLTPNIPVIVEPFTVPRHKMHQYTAVVVVLGVVAAFLSSSSSATAISCPPNPLEASPYVRHLCYAIEQAISENAIPDDQYRRVEERNVNLNAKRQDVDHVFLRFGRRFGL